MSGFLDAPIRWQVRLPMGGLTLSRRNSGDPQTGLAAERDNSFRLSVLNASFSLQTADWRLSLIDKSIGVPPAVYFADQDNFAVSVGTFIYRGVTGQSAIEAAFADFGSAEDFWDETFGSFCLAICKNGQLRLIPDRLGVYPLYCNSTRSIISSSFLTVLKTIERPTINRQAVYEYVFQGATYGDRTIVEQVKTLARGCTFSLGRDFRVEPIPTTVWQGPPWSEFDCHIDLTVSELRREFGALSQAFGDNVDTALSGGYDSRLILALLRDQGISPRIHVYGGNTDSDVVIAKEISAKEGFTLIHSDKGLEPLPSPETFAEIVVDNFSLFDGYPSDGIFEAGADAATRLERAAGGALALNGGGGEIFRNFFYLPDKTFTVRDVLYGFFSQFDPDVCAQQFDETTYLKAMGAAIVDVLGLDLAKEPAESIRLDRRQVEFLYPYLRCVFWMGRNNGVNNRLGYAATPFIELNLIKLALNIPIKFKNHGSFEAALIHRLDPALARHPSSYGGNFSEPVSLSRKLKDYSTMLRPPGLRRLTYRLQNQRKAREFPLIFSEEFLRLLIDPSFPILRNYFKIAELRSCLELNRICTLEYLFEKYGVSA